MPEQTVPPVDPSKPIPWDAEDPLERKPWETKRSNLALIDYAHMGITRSLRKLCRVYTERYAKPDLPKPPTRHLSILKIWSSKYHWQQRIDSWDVVKRQQDEEQWEKRWEEMREKEFTFALEISKKLEQMMASPVFDVQTSTEDGKATTIIRANKWTWGDVANLMERFSRLVRLSTGHSQGSYDINIQNLSRLSNEQLLAVYQQLQEQFVTANPGFAGDPATPDPGSETGS